jgi:hypothetical protein
MTGDVTGYMRALAHGQSVDRDGASRKNDKSNRDEGKQIK